MLKLKIAPIKSVLDGLRLNEPVCVDTINRLLKSNILMTPTTKNKTDERKQLQKYKNLIKDGFASVIYSRKLKYGRVYVDGSIGLFPLRWVLRHTLAARVGLGDYDIVCCHPTILLQICEANGLLCDKLREYVNDRENFLIRIMNEIPSLMKKTAEDRDIAKNLPLRIMYLGGLQNWAIDNNIMPNEIPEWLWEWCEAMLSQLTTIAEHIIKDNPKLVKELEGREKDFGWNHQSAVLSYFIQEYENRIIENIYLYCCEKGYIINNVCVLCLDGIMLEDAYVPSTILEELSANALRKTGFKIKFSKKAFDYSLTDQEIDSCEINEKSLDADKLGRFDTPYFNKLPNYIYKKIYFEQFVSKILRPDPAYVYIEQAQDDCEEMVFYNQSKITETFKHLDSGEAANNGEMIKFMTKWLNDEDIKMYNVMDFKPHSGSSSSPQYLFNLFRGFNPAIHAEYKKIEQDKLLKPFHDLGIQLCGGVEKDYKFFVKYNADIFQNPNKKNPLAFIVKGKQGCGKNVWLNAIGNALGRAHYITSSNPKDFFGDYAEGFYHKLLVNMNECEGKDTFDFEGRIKSFITEDTITLNRKFVQPITISNLARLVIFSNKNNPIPIDVRSKERRYVVYETTDEYLKPKYNSTFWIKLIAHFKKPEFIAALYDYLNEYDLSKTDWRVERPITKAYIQMCKLYIPTEVLFLANYFEEAQIRDEAAMVGDWTQEKYDKTCDCEWRKNGVEGEILYEQYNIYAKKYGFYKDNATYQKNIKSFYLKLGELDLPIISVKVHNVIHFKFSYNDVLKNMKEKKWIERNETDDEIIESEKSSEGLDKEFEGYF